MNVHEDYIVTNPYQPTEDEKAAINKLEKRGLVAGDWESQSKGIVSFKNNLREHMFYQQKFRCAYCRLEVSIATSFLQREHIVPKISYPQWMFLSQNLCIACDKCNNYKWDKEVLNDPNTIDYPSNSDAFKIIHPFIDRYSDHIDVAEDMIYKGKTEKGKFTIATCHLYRIDLALERARKKMEKDDPDSVRTQLLSLLENDENKVIVETKIDNIVSIYKQRL
mgnify:FL=1